MKGNKNVFEKNANTERKTKQGIMGDINRLTSETKLTIAESCIIG